MLTDLSECRSWQERQGQEKEESFHGAGIAAPLCQSNLDLTGRLSLKTAGPGLDREEPVLSCLNLVSFAESVVIAGLESRVAS